MVSSGFGFGSSFLRYSHCSVCSFKFPYSNNGNLKVYCSSKCRQKAYRLRLRRTKSLQCPGAFWGV